MTKIAPISVRWLGVALAAGLAAPAAAGPSDNSLTWSSDREVTALNPYFDTSREAIVLSQHVYDGLLSWDQESETFLPLLAADFRQIDATTMEFDLRQGVTFHDGSAFGPQDVVYTISFVIDPANGVLNMGDLGWIKGAEAVDEDTVRITFNEPYPAAEHYLAQVIPILPEGHFDGVAPERFASTPDIGTGPYKVETFRPGDIAQLARNADYFEGGPKGTPSIDTLTFRTISDQATQIAELMTGGIDWIWNISTDQAAQLQAAPMLTTVNAPTLRISYLTFDQSGASGSDVTANPLVRKAIAHAIDRQRIATALMGEGSMVINAACHPAQFACTQDVTAYDYDPEKAKALLAEAGYPNGLSIDFYGYRDREITEAIIGDLARAGITANLRWLQYAALRDLVRENKAPIANMTWGSSSIPDVSAITSYFFNGGVDDQVKDAELIKMIDDADLTEDPEARRAAYAKALERIAENAWWVPLFTYTKNYSYSAELDFTPTADELPRFYAARWKQ